MNVVFKDIWRMWLITFDGVSDGLHWLSIYIIIGLQKWLPFKAYFSLLWPCVYCMPLAYFMTFVNKHVANCLAIHTHWISFIFGIYHVTRIIAPKSCLCMNKACRRKTGVIWIMKRTNKIGYPKVFCTCYEYHQDNDK